MVATVAPPAGAAYPIVLVATTAPGRWFARDAGADSAAGQLAGDDDMTVRSTLSGTVDTTAEENELLAK